MSSQSIFLEGPVSVSVHVSEQDKIVILGDAHGRYDGKSCATKSGVLSVPEMISQINKDLEHSKTVVDVHLESPFVIKNMESTGQPYVVDEKQGYLFYDTYEYFKTRRCLQPDKTSCNLYFPHLRIHYDDVRIITSSLRQFSNLLEFVGNICQMWHKSRDDSTVAYESLALFKSSFEKNQFTLFQMKPAVDVIAQTWSEYKMPTANLLLNESRVAKETIQVKDSRAVKILQEWTTHIKQQLTDPKMISLLQAISDIVENDLPNDILVFDGPMFDINLSVLSTEKLKGIHNKLTVLFHELEQIYNHQMLVFARLQDTYMLARMFKMRTPINNVVYVGDEHAKQIRDALRRMDFKTTYSIGLNVRLGLVEQKHLPSQCQPLSELGWPWFGTPEERKQAQETQKKLEEDIAKEKAEKQESLRKLREYYLGQRKTVPSATLKLGGMTKRIKGCTCSFQQKGTTKKSTLINK
jgi:hypothetical protein